MTSFKNDEEHLLFNIQMGLISSIMSFIEHSRILFTSRYLTLNSYNLHLGTIDHKFFNNPLLLVILTSLRRWIKSTANHIMPSKEFDECITIPLFLTAMHTEYNWRHIFDRIDLTEEDYKAIAKYMLQMSDVIESTEFNALSTPLKIISYKENNDRILKEVCKDTKALEGLYNNERPIE